MKGTNICTKGVPEGTENEKGAESWFEEIMWKHLPNLEKERTSRSIMPKERPVGWTSLRPWDTLYCQKSNTDFQFPIPHIRSLGSCHSILRTSKKLDRLKNQQLFREMKKEDKALPSRLKTQKGKYQELWLIKADTNEEKLLQKPVVARKTWTVNDKSLEV